MKYYLIAGEASGDLHASHLMLELKQQDPEAIFRFIGGDLMAAAGGTLVKHYRELAYMGFVPVLLHLPTILSNMRRAKQDIAQWQPDVVILIDYPGFNLSIAKYVKANGVCPVYYYISPKIWAWKEYRIKNIKRDVDKLFSILPFEVEFFEQKHHYPIHYVGNPTADEVREFLGREKVTGNREQLVTGNREQLTASTPQAKNASPRTIALLAGSRRQEIKDNLPTMIRAAQRFVADGYELVLAGAPAIDDDYYNTFIEGTGVRLVKNQTYQLLSQAHAALVTSGTATLETALFGVPQVVCYGLSMPRLFGWLRRNILKVKYISLVNLVADREVVRELVADTFSQQNIEQELAVLLPTDSPQRLQMLQGYEEVRRRLGNESAPKNTARLMVSLLQNP
jgi:lipid-A-disaccharide synthase